VNKKLLTVIGVIVGILCLLIAVIYFITPAKNLPNFFPGFDSTLTKTHLKHAIGFFILGIGAFVFSWFQTGKKSPKKE
jgi:amino acid permease